MSSTMSSRPLRPLILSLGMLVAAGLALSGCGRKGELDLPSTPSDKVNQRSYSPPKTAPERPFVLDPLL